MTQPSQPLHSDGEPSLDPAAQRAESPTEYIAEEADKTSRVAAVIGGLALLVAIVALVLALIAKSDAKSGTESTQAVQERVDAALASSKNDLQQQIDKAEQTVRDLEKASSASDDTTDALKSKSSDNAKSISANTKTIEQLQADVTKLQAENKALTDEVNALKDAASSSTTK